jgi:hypothetical protein
MLKAEQDKKDHEKMDALARDVLTFAPGDPRRAQIVDKIPSTERDHLQVNCPPNHIAAGVFPALLSRL